jgi:isopentenyl-diphosphate delta-isomerase
MSKRIKEERTTSAPRMEKADPTAASRKRDHIELAFRSQIVEAELDGRFYYDPLFSAHPLAGSWPAFQFLGKTMRVPLWVSSMTGGAEMARLINRNLAQACRDFGMGMGLGSCRSLLYNDDTLPDFDVRECIGPDLPLFANLGIAQLETLADNQRFDLVKELLRKLDADGLIVHVNPLQEWLQPEGDILRRPPIDTITRLIDALDAPIIVKEVGQGMGYESLRALLRLPLAAVDFAANGGTNFAKLELLRSDPVRQECYARLANIGHSAEEMVDFVNRLADELGEELRCRQIIISGGIQHFLDGYYLIDKIRLPAIYGQASGFLRHARGDYQALYQYVESQVRGLELARAYLRRKPGPGESANY